MSAKKTPSAKAQKKAFDEVYEKTSNMTLEMAQSAVERLLVAGSGGGSNVVAAYHTSELIKKFDKITEEIPIDVVAAAAVYFARNHLAGLISFLELEGKRLAV